MKVITTHAGGGGSGSYTSHNAAGSYLLFDAPCLENVFFFQTQFPICHTGFPLKMCNLQTQVELPPEPQQIIYNCFLGRLEGML